MLVRNQLINRIFYTEFLNGNLLPMFDKIYKNDYEGKPVKKKASDVKLFDQVYALGNPEGNAATFSRGKLEKLII